jgi:hypothetical protein
MLKCATRSAQSSSTGFENHADLLRQSLAGECKLYSRSIFAAEEERRGNRSYVNSLYRLQPRVICLQLYPD